MYSVDENRKARLQKSLFLIRRSAGWTAEDLAKQLEITRQTITNLEHGDTTMSTIQYIAIRSVFEYEIEINQNDTLAKLIEVLVDKDDFTPEQLENVTKAVNNAEMHNTKSGGTALLASIIGLLTCLGYVIGDNTAAASLLFKSPKWLKEILRKQ